MSYFKVLTEIYVAVAHIIVIMSKLTFYEIILDIFKNKKKIFALIYFAFKNRTMSDISGNFIAYFKISEGPQLHHIETICCKY